MSLFIARFRGKIIDCDNGVFADEHRQGGIA